MNKKARKYFKADCVAISPLKLASGNDGMTDSDVLVDATGSPFIPGTTLCGIVRHHLQTLHDGEMVGGLSYQDYWFGYIVSGKDEGEESLIRFHEAFPTNETSVSSRDGVKLDQWKTAVDQSKHDYQVVDAGAKFCLRVEVDYDPTSEADAATSLLVDMVNGFQSGDIRIGGKTARGFGEVRLENMKCFDVDTSTLDGIEAYIEFDWDRSPFEAFELTGSTESVFEPALHVPLEVVFTLMIRDYGAQARSGYEGKLVDSEALKDGAGNPVIPGTSWAGAFRSHMLKVLKTVEYDVNNKRGDTSEAFLGRVFGTLSGNRAISSKVYFSESVVKGAVPLNATRTAIDRFTGGAANQRLFTNQIAYGGQTDLVIKWRKGMDETDRRLLNSLLSVCVEDLCNGALAVGGLTAVGAGIFRRRTDGCREGGL